MGQKQRSSSDADNEVKKRRRVGFSGVGEFHLFCRDFFIFVLNSSIHGAATCMDILVAFCRFWS